MKAKKDYSLRFSLCNSVFATVVFMGLVLVSGMVFAAEPVCNAGYYLSNGSCVECGNNAYCNNNTQYTCPANNQDLAMLSGGTVLLQTQTWSNWQPISSVIQNCYGDTQIQMSNGKYLAKCSWNGINYFESCNGNYLWYEASVGYYLSGYEYTSSKAYYNSVTACTNKPANSYYTGAGSPDTNNCAYTCNDGYLQQGDSCVAAITCVECEYYNGTTCTSQDIPSGQYATGGTFALNGITQGLTECPAGWVGSGATQQASNRQCYYWDCYKACPSQSIPGGNRIPVQEYTYFSGKYPASGSYQDCSYTTVCDDGYYLSGNTCVICESGYYCNGNNKYSCAENESDFGWKPLTYYNNGQIVTHNVLFDAAGLFDPGQPNPGISSKNECKFQFGSNNLDDPSTDFMHFYVQWNGTAYMPYGQLYGNCRPGYYLTGGFQGKGYDYWYLGCAACTNKPANAHYIGQGSNPESGNAGQNDCGYGCDVGTSTDDHGGCIVGNCYGGATGSGWDSCPGYGAPVCTNGLGGQGIGLEDHGNWCYCNPSLNIEPDGNSGNCKCKDGYTQVGNACVAQPTTCLAGYYLANATDTSCTTVGIGYYSPDGDVKRYECTTGLANSVYTTGSDRNNCAYVCSEGYYLSGGSCVKCEVGYYCSGGNRAGCIGVSYQDETGQSTCKVCPITNDSVGMYGYCYGGSCSGDIAGTSTSIKGCYKTSRTYQTDYATGTVNCYYTSGENGSAVYAGDENMGKRCYNWNINSCVAGYYAPTTYSQTTPINCVKVGAGYWSTADSITRTACPSGYNTGSDVARAQDWCTIQVPEGKYLPAAHTTITETCAAGTSKIMHFVNYGNTSSCDTCRGATYSGVGAASCTSCPNGYTANTTNGKTAATSCQISCPAGTRVAAAGAACTACAGGTYRGGASTVALGDTLACNVCPSGVNMTTAPGYSSAIDTWGCLDGGGTGCISINYCQKKNVLLPMPNGIVRANCYYTSGTGDDAIYDCTGPRGQSTAHTYSCDAGYYDYHNGGAFYLSSGSGCAAVGNDYYSADGDVTRTACQVGTKSGGAGTGADVASDCVAYMSLRNSQNANASILRKGVKGDSPKSLSVKSGNDIYYGNLVTDSVTGAVRLNIDGTTYYLTDNATQ